MVTSSFTTSIDSEVLGNAKSLLDLKRVKYSNYVQKCLEDLIHSNPIQMREIRKNKQKEVKK